MIKSRYITAFVFMLLSLALIGQTKAQNTITGQVVSADDGVPLPGVNIVVRGTTNGTTTDVDGNYTLDVESLDGTLVFSFVGYRTESIPMNGRTEIDLELEARSFSGDDIVVTAFGVEQQKRNLTFSTQQVNTENIAEAREVSVVNSLSGKVAGISINQAGTGLGGEPRVILRGNRSIFGSSQPLYIVDGVPIRGDVTDLNQDNIESIDVLKGPNAAALYGNRAQNGAIIITTKKGTAGRTRVSINQSFMARDAIVLTEYQNQFGQGNSGTFNKSAEDSWGPRMDGQLVDLWSVDPNDAGAQVPFSPQPNNIKDVYDTGFNSSTGITASFGDEQTQTSFTYTYTDADGIVPNNELTRHNLSVRVNKSYLNNKLNFDTKLTYMRENINNQLPTGENFANPIRHISRLPRNIRLQDARNFEFTNADGQNRQNFWNPGSNGGANPFWTLNRNLNNNDRNRIIGLASASYNFTEEFSLLIRGSVDQQSSSSDAKFFNDTFIIADNGQFNKSEGNDVEFNGEFLMTYDTNILRDFTFNANFGGNIRRERNEFLSANTGTALTVPNFFALSNTQNVIVNENVGQPRNVNSLYGFGKIGYKEAIFVDVSARNDWSSTLPADSRSFFYPSVGLSAVVSDLIPDVMPDYVSLFKIRGSWAEVGNGAPPFFTQRTANIAAGGNNGFLQLSTTIPNENLKPEQTTSWEVGFDMRLFSERLGIDFTAYKTSTTDQLFTVQVPVGSGASTRFINGGDVENKGLEFVFNASPIRNNTLSWDLTFNFSTNSNEVVSLSENSDRFVVAQDFLREFVIEEGEEFGQVFSRGFERDDQGRVIVGADGVPLTTSGLTVPVANFSPNWLGGINNSFFYKNFEFSFLIDIRQGGTISSITQAILDGDGQTKRTLNGRDGSLVFGDNLFGGEEAVLADGSPNNVSVDAETFWSRMGGRNAPVGEAFVNSASNIRMREVTFGYTLPQSIVSKFSTISNIKLSFVGRNLFFFTRASDIDPDLMVGTNSTAEGFDSFSPPSVRSFGANLKVDF